MPVLTLLGQADEPATLDGYGPIDLETARRLAGGAKSWVRILTHPVTGTVLDVDRKTYRVPKALRRWLGVREPVCPFPGCIRSARPATSITVTTGSTAARPPPTTWLRSASLITS